MGAMARGGVRPGVSTHFPTACALHDMQSRTHDPAPYGQGSSAAAGGPTAPGVPPPNWAPREFNEKVTEPLADSKRPLEPTEPGTAPADALQLKEKLLRMQADVQSGGAVAVAVPAPERGAGDWANYQPPSATLQAIKAAREQKQQQEPVATGHVSDGQEQLAEAHVQLALGRAVALPLKKDLPPALRARLAARGLLPQEGSGAGAATTGGDDLPPGWFSAVDPTYQTTYFYNPSTGERSWTKPAAAVAVPAPTAATEAAATAAGPLPPGWSEGKDPNSGHTYYYNPSTGQTQWEQPAATSAAAAAASAPWHQPETAATAALAALAPQQQEQQLFSPSPRFEGVRRGYVFKVEPAGCFWILNV